MREKILGPKSGYSTVVKSLQPKQHTGINKREIWLDLMLTFNEIIYFSAITDGFIGEKTSYV